MWCCWPRRLCAVAISSAVEEDGLVMVDVGALPLPRWRSTAWRCSARRLWSSIVEFAAGPVVEGDVVVMVDATALREVKEEEEDGLTETVYGSARNLTPSALHMGFSWLGPSAQGSQRAPRRRRTLL